MENKSALMKTVLVDENNRILSFRTMEHAQVHFIKESVLEADSDADAEKVQSAVITQSARRIIFARSRYIVALSNCAVYIADCKRRTRRRDMLYQMIIR